MNSAQRTWANLLMDSVDSARYLTNLGERLSDKEMYNLLNRAEALVFVLRKEEETLDQTSTDSGTGRERATTQAHGTVQESHDRTT